MKYLTYLIYILIYETLIIGGTGYAVFVSGHSAWWFVLAVFFSVGAYRPESWSKIGGQG